MWESVSCVINANAVTTETQLLREKIYRSLFSFVDFHMLTFHLWLWVASGHKVAMLLNGKLEFNRLAVSCRYVTQTNTHSSRYEKPWRQGKTKLIEEHAACQLPAQDSMQWWNLIFQSVSQIQNKHCKSSSYMTAIHQSPNQIKSATK